MRRALSRKRVDGGKIRREWLFNLAAIIICAALFFLVEWVVRELGGSDKQQRLASYVVWGMGLAYIGFQDWKRRRRSRSGVRDSGGN